MENKEPSYDELHKIILVGDSGVGKSSIVSRYTDNKFSMFLINTVGVDFKSKSVNIGPRKIRQQIWDTSGQERYKAITRNYFREADGIVVVYDVTDITTFTKIMDWLEEAYNQIDPQKCQKILIGNKTDLTLDRMVNFDEAENMALSLGMNYYETSAKDGPKEINKAFDDLSKKISEYRMRTSGSSIRPKESWMKKLGMEDSPSVLSNCSC